jgi:hypothetical protein
MAIARNEGVTSAGPTAQSGLRAVGKTAEKPAPKGRLPRYYGKLLLDAEQRSTIYSLQHQYQARLKALQQQLDKLRSDRDREIHQVLSPTQQRRLAELLAEASANRRRPKSSVAATKTSSSP